MRCDGFKAWETAGKSISPKRQAGPLYLRWLQACHGKLKMLGAETNETSFTKRNVLKGFSVQ